MRILYLSSEVVPFAKTGGLADVAAALPAALAHLGHEIKVVMPNYAMVAETRWGLRRRGEISVTLGRTVYRVTLWSGLLPGSRVEYLFLSNDQLFEREGLYQENGKDYADNLIRFAAFSRAVLDIPGLLTWMPEVIHANDWQTALSIFYLQSCGSRARGRAKIGTLMTIHNLAFTGSFSMKQFRKAGLSARRNGALRPAVNGRASLLKTGLLTGHILTTVSPTYSREIRTTEFGYGLESLLNHRHADLYGIINGVDYDTWDPANDRYLSQRFHIGNMNGKPTCKRALQRTCGLPVRQVPLLGMIARLTVQKGVDLLLEVLDELMRLDLQLVILGAGDPSIERSLRQAGKRYRTKLSVQLRFDEAMAHRIEAGADLFVMPSRYEPCGLSQLYSLRYGTIPIVRKTGGLADTVVDATPSNMASGRATGFLFESASGPAFLRAVQLALYVFRDRIRWKRLMRAAMTADFSWERSARSYGRLYRLAVKRAKNDGRTRSRLARVAGAAAGSHKGG